MRLAAYGRGRLAVKTGCKECVTGGIAAFAGG